MRVDYDRIADAYDAQPYRDKSADPDLEEFLAGRRDPRLAVLDIGCGTGNQVIANHARFPSSFQVGLDPFQAMLRHARRKAPALAWVRGDGADLPFRTSTFDFATSQYSFHHVARKLDLLREVARVLRPGGRFVLSNIDPYDMTEAVIYRYFPSARERDREDFPTVMQMVEMFGEAGLDVGQVVRSQTAQSMDMRQFEKVVARRDSCSQLQAISDVDYAAGLGRIRDVLRAAEDRPLPLRIVVSLVRITGERKG